MKLRIPTLIAVAVVLGATMPAQKLADAFSGKARFVVENTNFQPANASARMHFLSTVWHAGKLYTYYIENTSRGPAVGLALSSNGGASFSRWGRVVDVGSTPHDNHMRSFPGVYKDGGTWYMAMEASGSDNPGSIMLATSPDGFSWTVNPNPILEKAGGWEKINVGTPCLLKVGATWYLYYHGFGDRSGGPFDVQIGVASGPDLRNLRRYHANPILRTGDSGHDAGTVGKRTVVKLRRWYYMVYEVSTDQVDGKFGKARWSSAIARSRSPFGPWQKSRFNPILPVSQGFGNDGPELVRTPDGRWRVYFRAAGNVTKRATLQRAPAPQPQVYQAEHLYHQTGKREGNAWAAHTPRHGRGFFCYGPYTRNTPPGPRSATYRLLVDNHTADNSVVVTLDVYDADARRILAQRAVRRREFRRRWSYQDFTLRFDAPAGHRLEFRTYWHDTSYVRQDHVTVR